MSKINSHICNYNSCFGYDNSIHWQDLEIKGGALSGYHFDGQRSNEEVIFVIKRHPWVLAGAGFIVIILTIILILAVLLFGLAHFTSFLIVGVVLFFVIFGFYQWFIYNNYLYILTDQRIIIIEQNGLFGRKIIEAELEKIQNITTEIKGPIRTLLNFGSVTLRTAGIDPIMVLSNVDNPYEVQQKIIKYCKKYSSTSPKDNIIR